VHAIHPNNNNNNNNNNNTKIKNKKNTRTLAVVAPAEAGSIGSTLSVVWKEETAVFVRGRFWVERTALGIVWGQNEVVEAVQEEASPITLPGEPPKAKLE
jgi:hypothetical protein